MASTKEAIIQELLFRLAVVYIDRLTSGMAAPSKLLKSTEDLVWNSQAHRVGKADNYFKCCHLLALCYYLLIMLYA